MWYPYIETKKGGYANMNLVNIVETLKKDLPNTFIGTDKLLELNTGSPLNGGHIRALSARFNKLYNKVKGNPYHKTLFNAYWRSAFGIPMNQMNQNLYPIVKSILDYKLENDTDLFSSNGVPKEYVHINDIKLPIYNNENILYVRLEDLPLIGISPKTIIKNLGLVQWSNYRFNTKDALESAVEHSTKLWDYLSSLYGIKHQMVLYHYFPDARMDKNTLKASFPKLKKYPDSSVYFNKQKFFFKEKTDDRDKHLFVSLPNLKAGCIEKNNPTSSISQITEMFDTIENELSYTMFAPLEKYYSINFTILSGYVLGKRQAIITTANYLIQYLTEVSEKRCYMAASKFITDKIKEGTKPLTYSQWTNDDYLDAIKVISNINSENRKEIVEYARKRIEEWDMAYSKT